MIRLDFKLNQAPGVGPRQARALGAGLRLPHSAKSGFAAPRAVCHGSKFRERPEILQRSGPKPLPFSATSRARRGAGCEGLWLAELAPAGPAGQKGGPGPPCSCVSSRRCVRRLRWAVGWGQIRSRAAGRDLKPGDEPRQGRVRELGGSSVRGEARAGHLQLRATRGHRAALRPLRDGEAAAGRGGGGSPGPPAAPGACGGGTQRRAQVAEGRFEQGTARRGGRRPAAVPA